MTDSVLVPDSPTRTRVRPGADRSVRAFLESLADAGSFRAWNDGWAQPPLEMLRADPRYAGELAGARAATGLDEAAVTGTMRLRGIKAAKVIE